jgi:protein-disulfide isomerase
MSERTNKLTLPIKVDYDHIQGPISAPINIVEYGDYECPYTGMAYPIVKELRRRLGDSICFVFRNFPLNEIHPHAQHAAEAAEAAGGQDKFWQMHDHLFEHQNELEDGHLLEYAKIVGLDTERFKKEISEHVYVPVINKSLKNGIKSGVEGTPTFFLNAVRYEDSWELETLFETIRSAIKKENKKTSGIEFGD